MVCVAAIKSRTLITTPLFAGIKILPAKHFKDSKNEEFKQPQLSTFGKHFSCNGSNKNVLRNFQNK